MRIEATGLVLEQYEEFILLYDVDDESGLNGIGVANHEIPALIKALQDIQTKMESK